MTTEQFEAKQKSMNELDLYKFVTENNIEYHWYDKDVIMFVNCRDVEDFNKIIGSHSLDEEGIECRMKEGYFVFWMKCLCENNDIELNRVFTEKDSI